jgi:HSP20 family molecular chaperone IbpA
VAAVGARDKSWNQLQARLAHFIRISTVRFATTISTTTIMAASQVLDNALDNERSKHSRSSFGNSTSLQDPNNTSGMFLQEDDTCILLSLEMPGVIGSDLEVSLVDTTLTIGGYRRSSSSCCASRKRQRIHRTLEIDPNAIDVDRAMARVWNGCLTLYAPKKPTTYYAAAITSSSIIMRRDPSDGSVDFDHHQDY